MNLKQVEILLMKIQYRPTNSTDAVYVDYFFETEQETLAFWKSLDTPISQRWMNLETKRITTIAYSALIR